MTQPTNLATRYLTSLNRHLRKHGLGDTLSDIGVPHGSHVGTVTLYPFDSTDLTVFAAWLPTLRGVTVTVNGFTERSDRAVHLVAVGGLDDGTPVRVRVIVEDDQFDLLATNTPLVKDADIPVALLLSLVSADAAETRVEPVLAGAS